MGGAPAVTATVDTFSTHVLHDIRIRHFFDGVDMESQRNKQRAFLTFAFGGPNQYSGQDLRNAHAPLLEQGLDDSHFDAVVEALARAVAELEVPEDLVHQVLQIAASTREDVLGR